MILRLGEDSSWQPQQLRIEPNGASYGAVAFYYMHACSSRLVQASHVGMTRVDNCIIMLGMLWP